MRNCFYWLFLSICAISPAVQSSAFGSDRSASSSATTTANRVSHPAEVREFEVRVDNTLRGTHRLTIKPDGGNERVEVQTDVKVNVVVYAYVFKFRATEIWRDGRLLDSHVLCEDGSKKRSFSLKTTGDIQQISFNDKSIDSSSDSVMSTAYWRLPNVEWHEKSLTIADVDSGKTFTATLKHVGKSTVSADGQTINCRHFKIDGLSPAELWFDDRDRLVRQKSVEQGHATELRLKQIRTTIDE